MADYAGGIGGWSPDEVSAIADTVARSPALPNRRPWALRFVGHAVELHERPPLGAAGADLLARDRVVSCGAASASLELALRHLGRQTELELLPDAERPRLIARCSVTGWTEPTAREDALYAAMARRHSYRREFGPTPVDPALRGRLIADSAHGTDPRAEVVVLHGDRNRQELAGLLSYAASAIRADATYQRELSAWSAPVERGRAWQRSTSDTLPWGLIRDTTRLPHPDTLAERLRHQTTLIVLTAGDERLDQVCAGLRTQHLWLTAVDAGLVASLHTQSLQLMEVRERLVERLGLHGHPHLLMRIGHPAVPVRSGSATPGAVTERR